MKRVVVVLALLSLAVAAQAQKLTIVKAGPIGEVANLAEANEIRVVFSEPMVAVGKIPPNLVVPWFHIAPEVKGTFRWSGTTTLIFTPDEKPPLPFATKYDVTIDGNAKSVSGDTLGQPYTFSFITPTIQLLRTNWQRKNEGFNEPVHIFLRFNQPVDPKVIIQHLQLRTKSYKFDGPLAPVQDQLKPEEWQAFEAKRAKAEQTAASDGTLVLGFFAEEWDKASFPPSPDLVVLETKPGIPQGTHIQVYLDSELAQSQKNVRTGRSQAFTIELRPPFFVGSIDCQKACDPERANWLGFTTPVDYDALQAALTVTDITDPQHPEKLKAAPPEGIDHESSAMGVQLRRAWFLVPTCAYVRRSRRSPG